MNGRRILAAGSVAVALSGAIATAVAARSGAQPGAPVSEELARSGVVWHGRDLGAGERILLVIGGTFATRAEAEVANRRISFGDLQGYYVAPAAQFVGLREVLGEANAGYVLVTAFRTEEGAEQFVRLARAADAPAMRTPRLLNLGTEYVGLGQEPHPDGSGPLVGPLPGVTTP